MSLSADVIQAIQQAETAFNEWRHVPAPSRAQTLRQIAAALCSKAEYFARLMAEEMGKTLREGIAEVAYSADYFDWFAGEAERIYTNWSSFIKRKEADFNLPRANWCLRGYHPLELPFSYGRQKDSSGFSCWMHNLSQTIPRVSKVSPRAIPVGPITRAATTLSTSYFGRGSIDREIIDAE